MPENREGQMSLPECFVDRVRDQLGTEADAFLTALDQPSLTGLRVNTRKMTPAAFRERVGWELEPVPWCPAGLILRSDVRAGKHPDHAAGLFYMQEPSAMAVAEVVAPQPGELILDLCAAPGGKTTHLADLSQDHARLIANEIDPDRARTLAGNLERLGIRSAVVVSESPDRLVTLWGAIFDVVLVDAPCSGEGMFRKSPATRAEWSVEAVTGCALRQSRLIASAMELIRPGGRLVYSTCTLSHTENEEIVEAATLARPDFEITQTERLWPHHVPGEGHFVASLHRRDGPEVAVRSARFTHAGRTARNLWERFISETYRVEWCPNEPVYEFGERLFMVREGFPDLSGIRIVRAGLDLGTIRRDRFEPSHALALASVCTDVRQCLDLGSDPGSIENYRRGLTIRSVGEDGWLIVSVDGFPLGWGRRAKGVIKNAYPKGLRLPG